MGKPQGNQKFIVRDIMDLPLGTTPTFQKRNTGILPIITTCMTRITPRYILELIVIIYKSDNQFKYQVLSLT